MFSDRYVRMRTRSLESSGRYEDRILNNLENYQSCIQPLYSGRQVHAVRLDKIEDREHDDNEEVGM